MLVRVLGSAAGGGFPQWNCACPNCRGVRERTLSATPRTQASIAVSADGEAWFLLGASPDVRPQIDGFSALHPRAIRHSPIAGILLANGDLDHCLGLLLLREDQRLHVYATNRVRQGFTEGNVLYQTLERFPEQVIWHLLKPGASEQVLLGPGGRPSGLAVSALTIPGKVPLHLASRLAPDPEDNIGLAIRDTASGRILAYLPMVAARRPEVDRLLQDGACIFFDGTFWSSDELIALGVSQWRAEEMGHWPVGGPVGSLELLRTIPGRLRILIHINNSNPILREDGPEREALCAAGVDVAFDGMEFVL